MKNILIVFTLLAGFVLVGCEDFLDTKNLTKWDTTNYPSTEQEVQDLLTGAYRMGRETETAPDFTRCAYLIGQILSDENFGGAGNTSDQDKAISQVEVFNSREEDAFAAAWERAYATVFRCNTIIAGLGLIKEEDWSDKTTRDYVEGQAKFLRAYALFYIARMFGEAPMPLNSAPDDSHLERTAANILFGQIAYDLVDAIRLMPGDATEKGRASKWAAQAILGRVYLFYTGYYGTGGYDKSYEDAERGVITMPGDAGELTKDVVVGHLVNCIEDSGHGLAESFYSLWPYTNGHTREMGGYRWLDSVDPDKEIEWLGETGNNKETIFSWQFNASGSGAEGNLLLLFLGMRMYDYSSTSETQYERTFPFGGGWGFCTVNTKVWENWPDEDLRKEGSIIDMANPLEMNNYVRGADNWQQETGYMQKKYMPILVQDEEYGYYNYSKVDYPAIGGRAYTEHLTQDFVVVRFADVLLMAAELLGPGAGDEYLNRVRTRAGLGGAPGGATLENIQKERQWELAFEGVRWADMLRWGLDYATAAMNSQNGVAITNSDAPRGEIINTTTIQFGDHRTKLRETGGFLPIPNSEISKSGGKLTQTPGW